MKLPHSPMYTCMSTMYTIFFCSISKYYYFILYLLYRNKAIQVILFPIATSVVATAFKYRCTGGFGLRWEPDLYQRGRVVTQGVWTLVVAGQINITSAILCQVWSSMTSSSYFKRTAPCMLSLSSFAIIKILYLW